MASVNTAAVAFIAALAPAAAVVTAVVQLAIVIVPVLLPPPLHPPPPPLSASTVPLPHNTMLGTSLGNEFRQVRLTPPKASLGSTTTPVNCLSVGRPVGRSNGGLLVRSSGRSSESQVSLSSPRAIYTPMSKEMGSISVKYKVSRSRCFRVLK